MTVPLSEYARGVAAPLMVNSRALLAVAIVFLAPLSVTWWWRSPLRTDRRAGYADTVHVAEDDAEGAHT